MFQYKFVEANGKRYWISKAILDSEEGPQREGGDWYIIDLCPVDPSDEEIMGIDLIDWGDTVHITAGLDGRRCARPVESPGRFQVQTVEAKIWGDTLLVEPLAKDANPMGGQA